MQHAYDRTGQRSVAALLQDSRTFPEGLYSPLARITVTVSHWRRRNTEKLVLMTMQQQVCWRGALAGIGIVKPKAWPKARSTRREARAPTPLTHSNDIWDKLLLAAARKSMFTMRRRCASGTLLCSACCLTPWGLPILSYACEVCAVNPNVVETAEVVHRSLSTCQVLIYARPMKLYLQSLVDSCYRFSFWQQFCCYHRIVAFNTSCIVKHMQWSMASL